MDIKKGQVVSIRHRRHGTFRGVAERDFNTDENWYLVAVADGEGRVEGAARDWDPGDSIPCRKVHVLHIEVLEEVAA